MLKNYMKIAFRLLKKQKVYSLINISGLAAGIACCIFILLYVSEELSYDKFQNDAERIYRVTMDIESKTATQPYTLVAWPVAPALKENFPQVEQAVRLYTWGDWLIKYKEKSFYEDRFMWADPEVFSVLTFPFIEGNPQTALRQPNSIVISENMTEKYFNEEEPLGKLIQVNNRDYTVTGVINDPPTNTHLKYDFIASLKTIENPQRMSNWRGTECYTYIKLTPDTDAGAFEQQISKIADKYIGDVLKESGYVYTYYIQPVKDIHLYSNLQGELVPIDPPGSPLNNYIFSAIAVFVLLIACINFINLSTARSAVRAKEVGMRKVIGAHRLHLINQFLGESLLLSFFAVFLALFLVIVLLPMFNEIAGKEFAFTSVMNLRVISIVTGIGLFAGIAGGSFPAFSISAFKPATVIKGSLSTGSKKNVLRKVLVVGQFSISIILIIGVIVIYRQIDFMKSRDIGFDKEQKLIIQVRGGISLRDHYNKIEDELTRHPSVLGLTFSSHVPGRGTTSYGVRIAGEVNIKNQGMNHIYIDDVFINEYKIEIAAGRAYQKEISTDMSTDSGSGAFLLNEAAVKAFGWSSPEEAIGKLITTGMGSRTLKIIGVVKNFHYKGLQVQVEPLIIEYNPFMFKNISLTININNITETVSFLKERWGELYPGNPFEYFFLDKDFDKQYNSEEKAGKIVGVISFLGIFIACLGLLGLTAFMAQQRTKEIGIRKVLGASVPSLLNLLSKEFITLIAISAIFSFPISYYVMNNWLQNFAYRINIGIGTFVLSAFLAILLALLTVSYQSIKAATSNPVESLKNI
ncbi:ABC transporter permease [candidate division KSB1 bacterium]